MAGGGPKIIDVATERLDRRPVGPSGIEVTYAGAAKIIRIAPGYRMATAAAAQEQSAADSRQPWSEGWMRYCLMAEPTFDPKLGTVVGADGRVRFCDSR